MEVLTANSAAEAVAQGAQLLDERMPGWYHRIDLSTLDISYSQMCICGQLDWGRTPAEMNNGFTGADLGVVIMNKSWGYHELTREWAKAIQARRDADSLVVQKTEREVALI